MKTWVRRTARVGILSAGFLLIAGTATAANASPLTPAHSADANQGDGANSGQVSADNKGLVNGTQVSIPIQVPVNVCGNGVGVIGVGVGVSGNCDDGAVNGSSASTESAHVTEDGDSDGANDGQVSAGNQGILNGTQVYAPIQVPVNVCGNGVGVIGVGIGVSGNCDNGAVKASGAHAESAHATEDGSDLAQGGSGQTSADNSGILNGTQASVPIQVPVNVCGNGVGVIGVGLGVSGNCDNGAVIASDTSAGDDNGDHHGDNGGDYRDGDRHDTVKPAAKTQPAAKTKTAHKSKTKAGKEATTEAAESGIWDRGDDMSNLDAANDGQISDGNQGILNGTQVSAPIQVPVNVCGNGVGVIGVGIGVSGNCDNGAVNASGASTDDHHGDRSGRRDH